MEKAPPLLPLNRCISDFRVVGMPLGLRLSSLSYCGKPGSHLVVGVGYHSGSHLGRVFSGDPRVTHLTCGNAFPLHATDYQPENPRNGTEPIRYKSDDSR